MTLKSSVIVFLIAVGVFWAWGRERPVSILPPQQVTCTACGGGGFIQTTRICAPCRGSGKSQWFFQSRRHMINSSSQPLCTTCQGTGKIQTQTTCQTCRGRGTFSKGSTTLPQTFREDRSRWEQVLKKIGYPPPANPPPLKSLVGTYPLFLAYLDWRAGDVAYEVVDWGKPKNVSNTWQSDVKLQIRRPDGASKFQTVQFKVKNREIVDVAFP